MNKHILSMSVIWVILLKRLFLAGLVAACACNLGITDLAEAAPSTSRTLEASFKNPPDSARIWVYWFWLNGNITRGGITADPEHVYRQSFQQCLVPGIHERILLQKKRSFESTLLHDGDLLHNRVVQYILHDPVNVRFALPNEVDEVHNAWRTAYRNCLL